MSLDEFYAQWNGKVASFDGIPANAGQCVQLVEYYIVQVMGLQPFWGNAIDWWTGFGGSLAGHFTRIPYGTTTSYPKRDDIVIWNSSLPNSGGFGHIDICVDDGTPAGFTGFDSNWGGKYAHLVQHNYDYVIGVLRPEGETMPNAGDVINIYQIQDGRDATTDEIAAYTALPWSAPTGIYYGKVYPYVQSLQTDLKQARQPATVLESGLYEVK